MNPASVQQVPSALPSARRNDSLRAFARGRRASKVAVETTRRIPELDAVRGLAIALVVIFHYANINVASKNALYYALLPTHLMWSGVDLFFVLSGFLIGGILLDHRESRRYYQTFYLRRISRIFPLYYFLIALLIAGRWAFPRCAMFVGHLPLWTYPIFAQNLTSDFTRAPSWIGATWSLAVEEQFYLSFPAAVRFLSRKALTISMVACVFGAPLLRTVLVLKGWRFGLVHPLLPCRADALALGVIAAILMREEAAKAWITRHSRFLYGCLIASIAMLPALLKWTTYLLLGTVGYSLLAVMYFLGLILLLQAPTRTMKRAFNSAWLRHLGVISYCVYLVHAPVRDGIFLAFRLGDHASITGIKTLLATILALIASIAVAELSWMCLEKPLIKRAHLKYQY